MRKRKVKIINICGNIFSILTVLSFLFITVCIFTGTDMYSVATDSMSPTMKTGDVIMIRSVKTEDIEAGDIITVDFSDRTGSFTHRVTKVDTKNGWVYTKGDANVSEDPFPTDLAYVKGRVVFIIPALGFFSLAIGRKILLTVLASSAIILLIVRTVLESVARIKDKTKG
ncbi:MAG: signal peptidase I [Clostridiales bacterium]|nr:signal peptidase I [Clostridiales bacterium]